MVLGPDTIHPKALSKKNKKYPESEQPGCWFKFRFNGSCLASRTKADATSSVTSTQSAESKSIIDTSRDQPIVPVVSSSTTSHAESTTPSTPNIHDEIKISSQLRKFSFNELKSATRNFRPESLLGEGGFGCVFKGWINENRATQVKLGIGLPVAVKTLNHDGLQGHKEWLDYNAKLSDFGLAKDGPEGDKTHVSTREMGTYGYAAPEYVMTGHLTSNSDVYSFGVVLLEMLTGRRSMDKNQANGEHNLVEWARPQLGERRRFYRLIDPCLEGCFSIKGAQKAIQLASYCLSRDPKTRPLMSEVVDILTPLPNLKDMASSSSYFQAMQAGRIGSNLKARHGPRVQAGQLLRNGQPMRSFSIPNGPRTSPYHQNNPHRSPKPNVQQQKK
ncbi:hypothetical protein LWI29_010306 [Acer saccharum]|uniref:Protein kinase domain-containing protein n=1 Tax=Acer saccharum TaxID=4024 RepID=A0AA39S383_ACESA|nr:hypothetical protein LWI29_010306 [Acer saccharum]